MSLLSCSRAVGRLAVQLQGRHAAATAEQLRGLRSNQRREEGPPEREDVEQAIARYTAEKYRGPRDRWQVHAASWVKKKHVDRGDMKVGVRAGNGRFVVLDSLRPHYVVPDLTNCELRPYVSKAPPSSPAAAENAPAAPQ